MYILRKGNRLCGTRFRVGLNWSEWYNIVSFLGDPYDLILLLSLGLYSGYADVIPASLNGELDQKRW